MLQGGGKHSQPLHGGQQGLHGQQAGFEYSRLDKRRAGAGYVGLIVLKVLFCAAASFISILGHDLLENKALVTYRELIDEHFIFLTLNVFDASLCLLCPCRSAAEAAKIRCMDHLIGLVK